MFVRNNMMFLNDGKQNWHAQGIWNAPQSLLTPLVKLFLLGYA